MLQTLQTLQTAHITLQIHTKIIQITKGTIIRIITIEITGSIDEMGEKKKFIRDSVYGDISLTKFEEKIMDMPQFQRLRRIKQLGLISLIYPGANHTRFEHSVGTMNLGSKLATELDLSNDEIELIRVSSLLHDIGHGPFSHVSEGVLSVPHEELTKYGASRTYSVRRA